MEFITVPLLIALVGYSLWRDVRQRRSLGQTDDIVFPNAIAENVGTMLIVFCLVGGSHIGERYGHEHWGLLIGILIALPLSRPLKAFVLSAFLPKSAPSH